MDDITLLFNSKKYELDIKSITYFFNCINKKDEWNKNLSKTYENLSEINLTDLKKNLKKLRDDRIYDHQNKNKYSKLFTSLYEKKEAIDFLRKKIDKYCKNKNEDISENINKDISELYERIDPNSPTITIQKIDDTKKCIEVFNQFRSKKNNEEIFEYIKNLKDDEIEAFESYSKIYSSIIELDRNDNSTLNIFDQVDNIIKKAKFLFLQETESFSYGEEKKITMDELIHLKNKINISPNIEKKEDAKRKEEKIEGDSIENSKTKEDKKKLEEENKENEKNDLLKEKFKKLLFFKNLVTNMEVIYENMQILRTKGNNLPIYIRILVEYDKKKEAIFYLDKKESTFEIIETFLLNAKDDYIKKLDSAYKEKKHIRFLYGKLFRKLVGYLDGGSLERIKDIFRYILNKNNDDEIQASKPANPQITDYVKNYTDYNKNSFENIFNYLISLFEINGTTLQKHYEEILIKDPNKYKGVFSHECEENSIGKFIYELFLQKIGKKPIAQNILISSKETSIEEIQAFLYRAVLCDYNTLFVVEVNESLSDYQQGIMYNFLDELLIYKMDKYKESNKGKNIEKNKTKDYLDACIVFLYEKKNKDLSFINEIEKLESQDIGIDNNENNINDDNKIQKDNSNIVVISSDFCGLGKSFKIKKMIEEKEQNYFHFPLGGILTKKVISEKIFNLFEKIKKENEKIATTETKDKNKTKNAIHLDLTESEETSIINEFLFAFLITKFYTNNETIIYIPKNIEIYIEIPNCFSDYLAQFGILKIFPRQNITLENKPELNLPDKTIEIFKRMVALDSNKSIEEKFLKKYMNNPKNYSYHQIIIFIKLFISQYNKFDKKLYFTAINNKGEKKDVTESCIRDFAKSTKYFIDGGFQNLIMKKIDEEKLKKEKKDHIDLLSDAYENDLKGKKFDIPLIFIIKEKMIAEELEITKIVSNKNNSSKDYLESMKKVLNIPNEVETEKKGLKSLLSLLDYETDNYVITNDNFIKMILLVYRIIADIPVIIMGETGCGKTALITKLSQILNNGKILVEIINIHPGITDKYLCKKMEEMNEKAEKSKTELWVFFDEINTCLSLSLLTEIFVNKTFNGKKLNDKIRLIGACNPYRRRKQGIERCGYGRENEKETELVYLVQPLPQSLLNYVFSFGALNEEDEKKYIYSIIKKLFKEGEEKLHEATKEVIFKCHKYLRETFDTSVVSLREISRFGKIVEFFQKYFVIKRKCEENKDDNITEEDKKKLEKDEKKSEEQDPKKINEEKFDKTISIICSVYLCYYIRLINEKKRVELNNELRESLITLANSVQFVEITKQDENSSTTQDNENDDNIGKEDLVSKVDNKLLKNFIQDNGIKHFSDFLRIEEQFLLDKIELKKGIGKNDLLKENLFLMFVAVTTGIPLIIVGKPGTGKSLSSQLIYNSMRGEYSKDKFFREFPQIILSYFQGSKATKPEDIEKLFEIAENKLKFYKDKEEYKNKLPISMILFDELGLAEQSESNPLKVLHSKLEYSGKEEGVSFIGISNYSLDAAKVNRAMNLSVPNLEEKIDQLISTSYSIVESISEELNGNKIFEILSRAYYGYKTKLMYIKDLMVLYKYNQEEKIDTKTPLEEIKSKKKI
jgi:MoxR-like ATPase